MSMYEKGTYSFFYQLFKQIQKLGNGNYSRQGNSPRKAQLIMGGKTRTNVTSNCSSISFFFFFKCKLNFLFIGIKSKRNLNFSTIDKCKFRYCWMSQLCVS